MSLLKKDLQQVKKWTSLYVSDIDQVLMCQISGKNYSNLKIQDLQGLKWSIKNKDLIFHVRRMPSIIYKYSVYSKRDDRLSSDLEKAKELTNERMVT